MSHLSVFRHGRPPAVSVANPIYLTSPFEIRDGAKLTFELFQEDAEALEQLLGTRQYYVLESQPFWGTLERLEACPSIHPTLSQVANTLNKATVRGVLSVIEETARIQ
jgi:hypothetical protein